MLGGRRRWVEVNGHGAVAAVGGHGQSAWSKTGIGLCFGAVIRSLWVKIRPTSGPVLGTKGTAEGCRCPERIRAQAAVAERCTAQKNRSRCRQQGWVGQAVVARLKTQRSRRSIGLIRPRWVREVGRHPGPSIGTTGLLEVHAHVREHQVLQLKIVAGGCAL